MTDAPLPRDAEPREGLMPAEETVEQRRARFDARPVQPIELRLADLLEGVDLRSRLFTRCAVVESPLGETVACWSQLGLSWVRLLAPGQSPVEAARSAGRPMAEQTDAPGWVQDAVGTVSPTSVDLTAITDFQRRVLEAAREIPRGQTRTYADLARVIGSPKAVRAVGTALARNPVPLVVPCHRVVPSSGGAGQYIFGVPAKVRLLQSEGVQMS